MGVKSQRSTLAFFLVSLMILSTISIQLGLSEYSFEIVEEYDENDYIREYNAFIEWENQQD